MVLEQWLRSHIRKHKHKAEKNCLTSLEWCGLLKPQRLSDTPPSTNHTFQSFPNSSTSRRLSIQTYDLWTNIIQTTTIPMEEKVQRRQHLAGGAINWSTANPPYFTKPRGNFPRKDCLLAYSEQKWPAQMSPVICHHYLNYFKRNCSLYSKVEEYPNGNLVVLRMTNSSLKRSLKPDTSIIRASMTVKVSALVS